MEDWINQNTGIFILIILFVAFFFVWLLIKQHKNIITWIEEKTGLFIVIVMVVALIAPRVLTIKTGIELFHFTDPVGDTIGGLMGPVLNFLGIILLYLTLKSQNVSIIKQGKDFNNQRDFESLSNLVNTIKNDFEKIRLTIDGKNHYQGIECFHEFKKILNSTKSIPFADSEKGLKRYINNDDVEVFFIKYNFILFNIINLLKRNYDSSLSFNNQTTLYGEVKQLIRPIFNFNSALSNYITSYKNDELKEFTDLMEYYTDNLDKLFNKYKPKEHK